MSGSQFLVCLPVRTPQDVDVAFEPFQGMQLSMRLRRQARVEHPERGDATMHTSSCGY
jgi:hypothetical protein